jgi:hypothetical protein
VVLAGLLAISGVRTQAQDAATPEAPVRAGGLPARPSAADYQFHAQAGTATIAAEFMGHGVPTLDGGPYTTEDYVIVEAAIFGAPGARMNVTYQDFSLRLNGKKMPLPAQSTVLVFKTLKDPDWEPTQAEKDKGKTSMSTGGGGAGGPTNDSLPALIKMPMPLRHAMEQRVLKVSLAEGERALPQAGLLFFEFHGAEKNIRSLELIYSGPAGKATLPIHQ